MTKLTKTKQWEDQVHRIGFKQRFGQFSRPVGLSIGEDAYSRPNQNRRDPLTGEVTLRPKNFYTKHKDKGFHGGVFARTGYITVGDDFKDFKGNNYLRDGNTHDYRMHGNDFKPSGAKRLTHTFQHFKQYDDKKFDTRNQDGSVKTGLRNFTTQPIKKGAGNNGLFGKNLYALDPFERREDLARAERFEHYNKINARFVTTNAPKPTFDDQYKTYGGDDRVPPKKVAKSIEPSIRHSKGWVPSNPAKYGYNKTLTPHPYYEPDPPKTPKRGPTDVVQHPGPWYPSHRYKTEPDPSKAQLNLA